MSSRRREVLQEIWFWPADFSQVKVCRSSRAVAWHFQAREKIERAKLRRRSFVISTAVRIRPVAGEVQKFENV